MTLGSILGDVLKNYSGVPQSPSDVQNVPHHEVVNHFNQFAQQASPQQVNQASQQAYQQLPPDQQQSVFSELLGALTQNGVSPQQAGAQENDPSAFNFGQILQFISQRPDLLQSVFGQNGTLNSPIAKMVLAGVLAVAANQYANRGNKATNKGSMI